MIALKSPQIREVRAKICETFRTQSEHTSYEYENDGISHAFHEQLSARQPEFIGLGLTHMFLGRCSHGRSFAALLQRHMASAMQGDAPAIKINIYGRDDAHENNPITYSISPTSSALVVNAYRHCY